VRRAVSQALMKLSISALWVVHGGWAFAARFDQLVKKEKGVGKRRYKLNLACSRGFRQHNISLHGAKGY
jgi:hypothetical protein